MVAVPARMRDVAAAADCSVMTVSLALRNSRQVSIAMRTRIQALAYKLGYKPNPLVTALMVQRRNPRKVQAEVIAVLIKENISPRLRKRSRAFYTELWEGMEQRAEELGFRLEEFPVHRPHAVSGEELNRILTARGIRGVVLFPSGNINRPFPELDWNRFATVGAAYHSSHLGIHRVVSDHAMAMELALNQALRRGYQRIGLAMTRQSDSNLRYTMSGRFFAWQQSLPHRLRIPLIPGETSEPEPERLIRWYRKYKLDLLIALRAEPYGWLVAQGIKIPRDVGLIQLAKREANDLAGVNPNTNKVGRTTINLLVRELYFGHFGLPETPEIIHVSGRWMDGKTLREM